MALNIKKLTKKCKQCISRFVTGRVCKILSEKEAADLSGTRKVIQAWQVGQIRISSRYVMNKRLS